MAMPPPPPGFQMVQNDIPPPPPGFRLVDDKETGPNPIAPFSALYGATQGAQDILHGAVQGLFQAGGTDEEKARMADHMARREQNYQSAVRGAEGVGNVGRFVGNVAAMPIPGSQGVTTGGRVADAALKGASAGAVLPSDDIEQRAQNAVVGGVFGGALDGAAGYVANKISNARAGNYGIPDDARKALDFAESQGLRIAADDLSSNPTARYTGSFIDNIPIIGRGEYRKLQGDAAEKAAKDFISQFGDIGDDAAGAVNQSARNVLTDLQKQKRELYLDAFASLDDAGNVGFERSRKKAAELLQKEQGRGSQADPAVISELQRFIESPAGPMSFWHSVRSDIGAKIRSGMTGENQVIMDRGGAVLTELKAAADDEFLTVAEKIGGKGAAAWKRADQFYKDKIVPYRKSAIKQALASDDYERVLNLVAGSGASMGRDSKSIAQTVYRALDDQGRKGVSFAMLSKAFEKASTDGKPFHPAIFARNLEAIENRLGVFLPKEQKRFADGLQKYMRHIEAAGQYAHNPPTGRQLYGLALGAGAVAEPTSVLTGAMGIQGLKALYDTPRGRSLALAMSRVTPESEQAAMIAGEISSFLTRSGVVAYDPPGQ